MTEKEIPGDDVPERPSDWYERYRSRVSDEKLTDKDLNDERKQ